jgi:hypothetical protein
LHAAISADAAICSATLRIDFVGTRFRRPAASVCDRRAEGYPQIRPASSRRSRRPRSVR